MVEVVERVAGRYEVQEVEFGRVYKWCPESVVVDCDCGERVVFTSSTTTCQCGVDHTSVVAWEERNDRSLKDEAVHPWRYAKERKGAKLPY